MKKLLLCFFTVLFCMSLMGCIDVVQHITRKSDGTDQNTVCITASKIALEAAARMSNEHINYDELFEEYKFSETDLTEYKQFSAKFTKINDAVNMGFLIDNRRVCRANAAYYMPFPVFLKRRNSTILRLKKVKTLLQSVENYTKMPYTDTVMIDKRTAGSYNHSHSTPHAQERISVLRAFFIACLTGLGLIRSKKQNTPKP